MSRPLLLIVLAGSSAGLPNQLGAQTLNGSVVAAEGATPIAGATIATLRSKLAVASDRLGRFSLTLTAFPDTIVVSAIGWRPDTVPLAANPEDGLTVRLSRAALIMADLLAVAAPSRRLDLAEHGQWTMPLAHARTIPPAVETDVFRALTFVPAVTFSSPLSARPSIRGYDAQDVATRIDGFEILNLYHLGRIFSSFPADAAEAITVSTAPYPANHGGSIAGIIDITGRTGQLDRFHAGAGWSYGSLSAYAGGGGAGIRYFANARLFYWKALDLVPNVKVPYGFEDLYAGAVFGSPERPRGRVTVFATQDRAGNVNQRSYLHWDNLMTGGRWRILDHGAASLEASASVARFTQRGEDVPGLYSIASTNIRNQFSRSAAGLDFLASSATSRVAAGLGLGWRSVANRIVESTPAPSGFDRAPFEFPAADLETARLEVGGYLNLTRQLGPATIEAAVRLDAAASRQTIQPRLHARWALNQRVELSAAAGRTSRLYHVLSEARSEPEFDFLDFWLSSSDSIPAAIVDHGSIDLRLDLSPVVARLSLYRSDGNGLGELRPSYAQRPTSQPLFRFGRSRTSGVEAQLALSRSDGALESASVSYVLARSQRRWGDDWVPWALDRRHQFRGFAQVRTGGWAWSGALDLASGLPITPIAYTLPPAGVPGIPPGTTASGRAATPPVYGVENSAATSGTFRFDVATQFSFGGPGRSRFTLGVAVINLFGTAVAPFGDFFSHAVGDYATDPSGSPLPYRRLFNLPPIPTVTIRADF